MFCSNCGTEMSGEAMFCPECGTRVAVARGQNGGTGGNGSAANPANPAGPSAPQGGAPSFSGNISLDAVTGYLKNGSAVPGKAVAVVQVVLAVLTLLPMFSLDLVIYSEESSVIMLFPTLSKFVSYVGSNAAAIVYAWAGIISIIWLAAVVLSVFDAMSAAKGKKPCGVGSVLYLVLGIVVLVSCFAVNAMVSSKSIIAMNVLSATPWAWILTILAAALTALLAMKGGFSKPQIPNRQ